MNSEAIALLSCWICFVLMSKELKQWNMVVSNGV